MNQEIVTIAADILQMDDKELQRPRKELRDKIRSLAGSYLSQSDDTIDAVEHPEAANDNEPSVGVRHPEFRRVQSLELLGYISRDGGVEFIFQDGRRLFSMISHKELHALKTAPSISSQFLDFVERKYGFQQVG